ncbi:serine/threonine protein kinase [Acidobacteriota bacterium]
MSLLNSNKEAGSFLQKSLFVGGGNVLWNALAGLHTGEENNNRPLDRHRAETIDASSLNNRLPEKLGRYHVIEFLGGGAMGKVYRGTDDLLDREVALKVISAGFFDMHGMERFLREAKATAKLDHPNIVKIYDFGFDEGHPYLAMELLRGRNLQVYLRENAEVKTETCIRIILEVCDGLAHAHQQGIVHRDIKPANIFLASNGQVKILDFGVARILSDASRMTLTGTIIGTPQYKSPEEVRGNKADHRSDIFSTGIMLYEMLARRCPFDGDSVSAVLRNIDTMSPLRFSELALPYPQDLEAIVFRALAKKPKERYQSIKEMASNLHSALGGEPVSSVGPDPYKGASGLPEQTVLSDFRVAILWKILAGAILLLLLGWGTWNAFFKQTRIPSKIETLEDSIVVLDQWGEAYWQYRFDERVSISTYEFKNIHTFLDVNGNDVQDLVIGISYDSDQIDFGCELFIFDSTGDIVNRVKVGRELTHGTRNYLNRFHIVKVESFFTIQGEPRILVIANHRNWYPSLVWLLDGSGHRLQEFVNDGNLTEALLWDIDNDGEEEIIIGGTNNAYDCPVLAVLETESFGGASPPGGRHEAWAEMGSPGKAAYYIRFPNIGIGVQQEVRNSVAGLQIMEELINASVNEEWVLVEYRFSRNFEESTVVFNERTRKLYNELIEEKPTLLSADEQEEDYRKNILFWTGKDWIATPKLVSN